MSTKPNMSSRPRDLRLDFFRGLAMFIILLAHTPGNSWTLWIPARFGFSDATEIFVFCSGMASSLAFGTVFVSKSWWLGTARIVFRVWQVYWAHIGVFLVTAIMLFSIDHFGVGYLDRPYTHAPFVVPLFTKTGEALIGLLSLTYVPGLFDILPMYLVILAMVPVLMLFHRFGGVPAVIVAVLGVWVAANLAGYALNYGDMADPNALQSLAIRLGGSVQFLNLPSYPWGDNTWFFNPFGWQLIFFSGFAFGMGWIPVPPVSRTLVLAAVLYLLLTLPLAWFKIHAGQYLPDGWLITTWIQDFRAWIEPLRWKSWVGGMRFLHFLAVAYLAWAAVGALGHRLRDGWPTPPVPRRVWLIVAGIVLILTVPYTYIHEIAWISPALDRLLTGFLGETATALFGTDLFLPPERIGLAHLAHLVALVVLVWAALGQRRRLWIVRDGFLRTVPIIRKVGTQSLAVFMVSIPLARFNGWVMDWLEQPHMWGDRDVWVRLLVNGWGFAVLIGVAFAVGWFKRQPWRTTTERASKPESATPSPAFGNSTQPAE